MQMIQQKTKCYIKFKFKEHASISYISEKVGFKKPDKRIFKQALTHLNGK